MTDRRPSPRRVRFPAQLAAVIAGVALLGAACGGQIPFGTPRASGVAPTAGPSAAASAVPSGGPSTGASPTVTAAPSPSAGATQPASASPGASAPLPTPPAVAVTYSLPEVGFALTLPPGWVGYDAKAPEAAIEAAAREHPELREAFDRLQGGQTSFVAVDASATGDSQAASMTIGMPGAVVPPGPLLEGFARSIATEITANQPVDGSVEVLPVELPFGPGYNLRWQLEASGDEEALGLDAYVVSPGRTYLVTFAAPASVVEGFRPAFEAIVGSMQAI